MPLGENVEWPHWVMLLLSDVVEWWLKMMMMSGIVADIEWYPVVMPLSDGVELRYWMIDWVMVLSDDATE